MSLLARILASPAVKAAISQIAEILVFVAANVVVAFLTDSRKDEKQIKKNNKENHVQLLHPNQANS
jgi:hypothetical protein